MRKGTWIVLGLLAILVLIYVVTQREKVSVGVMQMALPTFAADTIDRIEISGKQTVQMQKADGSWVVIHKNGDTERRVKADESNVQNLLESALALKSSHYVTNLPDKMESLDLTPEKSTTVQLFAGDKSVWVLTIGKAAEASGRYAKLPEDPTAYVVKGNFHNITRGGFDDWRDRNVATLKAPTMTKIKIKQKAGTVLSLEKTGQEADERWKVAADQPDLPPTFRANDSAAAAIAHTLAGLRAASFIDKPENLGEPILKVAVEGKDAAAEEISFFEGQNNKILARSSKLDQVYEVAKNSFDGLNKKLEDVRDLSVMKLDKEGIKKLVVNAKGGPVTLEKTAEGWKIITPKTLPTGYEFDPETVPVTLESIGNLMAIRKADAKADQAKTAIWKNEFLVELTNDAGEKSYLRAGVSKVKDEHIVIGNIDKEEYVVKSSNLAMLQSIDTFKKQNFELPSLEGAPGFESLPVDVQRKLIDHGKKLQQEKKQQR
jgi:hypothetical protein